MFYRLICASITLAASFGAHAAVDAKAAAALAQKSACLACHSVDKAAVGPAFKQIATKYAADKGAEARLIDKVKKGGSGSWGAMAMPPNAHVADADIKTLVQWILSLK